MLWPCHSFMFAEALTSCFESRRKSRFWVYLLQITVEKRFLGLVCSGEDVTRTRCFVFYFGNILLCH